MRKTADCFQHGPFDSALHRCPHPDHQRSPSQPAREPSEILSAAEVAIKLHSIALVGDGTRTDLIRKEVAGSHEALRAALARAEARLAEMAEALTFVAETHHHTVMNSRMHAPDSIGFEECPCKTCYRATQALALPSREDTGTETADPNECPICHGKSCFGKDDPPSIRCQP